MVTEVRARTAGANGPRPSISRRPSLSSVIAARVKTGLATTPGRLRLASVAIVAVVVLIWVAGATTVGARQTATHQVGLETEPLLVGAQGIYAGLADADATAATAFLTGGLEPASLRARYDGDIKAASDQLADVTRQVGTSADASAAVRTMTEQLPVYTGLVEAARANNRQGFPVGAAYLRAASNQMRHQILPAADQLYQVEAGRLDQGYRSGASALDVVGMLAAGLLVLAVLFGTQVYLSRRTNRTFNIPLLAGSVVVVVLVGWVLATFVTQHHHLTQARQGGSDPVKVLAQARILALTAQSDESLTLIARGNGQQSSTDFDKVVGQLGGQDGTSGLLGQATRLTDASPLHADVATAVASYRTYQGVHQQVRSMADSGNFDKAVVLAVGNESTAFVDLNNRLGVAVNDAQSQFTRNAASARNSFGWLGIGVIVLSVVVGLLALVGAQQRINDYR